MRSVKELRKKAAQRPKRKAAVYSTSEARANFAEALETTQVETAIIGFDRYGRLAAVLAPVEAVLILAGLEKEVHPRKREAIKEAALLFAHNMPGRANDDAPRKKAPKKKRKPQRKPLGKTA